MKNEAVMMSGSEGKFIEVVTARMEGDAELQMMARQQLGDIIDPDAKDGDLEVATAKIGGMGSQKWRWFWLALVMVVSVPIVVVTTAKLRQSHGAIRGSISPIMSMATVEPERYPVWAKHLSDQERLVLFGAEGAHNEVDRWLPLWESDRENPVYFQEYAMAYLAENKVLPPEFLETGKEIDPGNGWYAMMVAVVDADSMVKANSIPRADREAGVAIPYDLLDEEELKRRMAQLHGAALEPRLLGLQYEMMDERFELLPPAEDFMGMVQGLVLAADTRFSQSTMDATKLIAAEAQRCQRDEDREGFGKLIKTWERLVDTELEQSQVLVEGLLVQALMAGTLPSMRDAAMALEMNGSYWEDLERRVRERKQEISKRRSEDKVVTQHGSMLSSLALPAVGRMVTDPPLLTIDHLRPSVRVEQALLGRVLSSVGWQLMGLILLVPLLVSLSVPKLVRVLGVRMQGLLGFRDWMWIFLGGVLAPLIIFLLFRYATPLSRLDWGPRSTLYAVPIGHFIALLVMWLVWPMAIAAWRLEQVGHVFGWTLRKRVFAWFAVAAPPVAMILLGLGIPMGAHSLPLAGAAILGGVVALVWLCFRPGVGGQKGFSGSLQRSTLFCAVRPAWLGGMLGFALLVPFLQAEERRWMKLDEVMKSTTSMTAYEGRVTEQLKLELRALLDAPAVE